MSVLGDEIDHLAEFGWSDANIANRLGCTISAVQKHLTRERLRALASQEAAKVYSSRTEDWIN